MRVPQQHMTQDGTKVTVYLLFPPIAPPSVKALPVTAVAREPGGGLTP